MLPILLFLLLGMAEAAFLYSSRHAQQTSADVLADAAAERIASDPAWEAGWPALVSDEAARSGCASPDVDLTYPDGSSEAGDRVRVLWACPYEPVATRGLWPGLVIRVQGESVIRTGASS